jgi:hypothetical protein
MKPKATFTKILKNKKSDSFVKELQELQVPFSIRQGSDCVEMYVDDTHYVFASKKRFPTNKIYLFNAVKSSSKTWLQNNKLKMPKKAKSKFYNYDYDLDKGKLTGTDLNHAYWRIAYLNGFITKKTYNSGLFPSCKELRLATLSVLGREKLFTEYDKNGKKQNVVYQERDVELNNIFVFIRETCWSYMKAVSKLLGDDFYSWNVDCIYYRDTPENRKIVQDYFESKKLTFKQLVY